MIFFWKKLKKNGSLKINFHSAEFIQVYERYEKMSLYGFELKKSVKNK